MCNGNLLEVRVGLVPPLELVLVFFVSSLPKSVHLFDLLLERSVFQNGAVYFPDTFPLFLVFMDPKVTSTAEWSDSGQAWMQDCALLHISVGMYHRSSLDLKVKSLLLPHI